LKPIARALRYAFEWGGQIVAVRLARVDRQDWFDGLYSASYRAVMGSVYFVVLDRDVAAEITHDAFLRLWEHYGRLPSGSNEKAWLIRVATNLAISHRRSQGAAYRRHSDYLEPADPGLQALNNLDLVRVRRALLMLEPRDRAVISLRFDEGLGFAEIGAIVGKPENTVKTRFHRALATLRQELGDANPFGVDSPTKEGPNG
jgi:RNA polymerase sigma-70 factor (ECF subfamily)